MITDFNIAPYIRRRDSPYQPVRAATFPSISSRASSIKPRKHAIVQFPSKMQLALVLWLLLGLVNSLHFIPANNPYIHYVGRWTSTLNQLRRDGTFPGKHLFIHPLFTICISLYMLSETVQCTHRSSPHHITPHHTTPPQLTVPSSV